MVRSKNALILLSAGKGTRMGRNIPKMLIPVMGQPLLYWALKNLERCSSVHAIVVAAPAGLRRSFESKVRAWRFKKVTAVVDGGKERTDSTRNALKAVPKDCGWIGIHDGARPFVSSALVRKCFDSARKSGAAILAVPCTDTVKVVRDSAKRSGRTGDPWIRETLPRGRCWCAQTPQVFRRDIADEIHGLSGTRAARNGSRRALYTDDASIAESMGFKVRIVPGSHENIKLTTPDHLVLARSILRKRIQSWR